MSWNIPAELPGVIAESKKHFGDESFGFRIRFPFKQARSPPFTTKLRIIDARLKSKEQCGPVAKLRPERRQFRHIPVIALGVG